MLQFLILFLILGVEFTLADLMYPNFYGFLTSYSKAFTRQKVALAFYLCDINQRLALQMFVAS